MKWILKAIISFEWTGQGKVVELHVILESPYLIIISKVFVATLKAFLYTFFAEIKANFARCVI